MATPGIAEEVPPEDRAQQQRDGDVWGVPARSPGRAALAPYAVLDLVQAVARGRSERPVQYALWIIDRELCDHQLAVSALHCDEGDVP